MNRGIVIVAYDTDYIEYTKIAKFCAKQAKKHLRLPVTLITDNSITSPYFDQVIIQDNPRYQHRVFNDDPKKWKNFNRYSIYNLSPYDHTLLLDCDYIVNSDQLNKLWDLNRSFLCHGSNTGISKHYNAVHEKIGQYELNLFWATVVMFKKDNLSKMIFDMWHMVQQNYVYYAGLFKFNNQLYRNDYALSIALNTISGHMGAEEFQIPYPLINIFPDVDLSIDNEIYELKYLRNISSTLRPYKMKLSGIDLHLMNKEKLLEFCHD